MELIAIGNLQSQEKKLKLSIYWQIVVNIESGPPKSHFKYKEKCSPPSLVDCLTP